MKRCAAMCLCAALLLGGCAANQVDINNTAPPDPTALTTPEVTPMPTENAPVAPSPEPGAMVRVVDIIQNIYTDIRYATDNNFTGETIYDSPEVYLRYSTALKLSRVQERLKAQGYSLCIWDGWRPVAAQFTLWRVCPDARYVANPFNGVGNHCRGNTVDITLVTLAGESVEMPTDFDNFTALADRDYSDVSAQAAENARLLEREMAAEGFTGYSAEWWHYTDSDSYDVCDSLLPAETVDIITETPLLAAPDDSAEELYSAPAGAAAEVIDRLDGGWLLLKTDGAYGYAKLG